MITFPADAVDYIEMNSFETLYFDDIQSIDLQGKQIALAILTYNGEWPSNDVVKKYITEKGGKFPATVKKPDYLIVTPISKQKDAIHFSTGKYAKYLDAVNSRKNTGKPIIIRDIDFFDVNNLFSKLTVHDKRRIVMDSLKSDSRLTEKTKKKAKEFIASNGEGDVYLNKQDSIIELLNGAAKDELLIPDEKDCVNFTIKDWRKYFSLSVKNGTVEIKKCYACNSTIYVPELIDNMPVTSIARYAFNLGESVKEVVLPKTVCMLANCAFYYCMGLERVVIKNPDFIANQAEFSNCKKLMYIIIGEQDKGVEK